ncbi:MAG: DUF3095 domain-containing protein [Oscillatoria sp. PMC 1068.18]|nr:DUF3095 domain-containing protein [Oscillatoria sp. PMC 1076.18]MEC4988047.1 DUF3095 domain-containing protein [Oscillatoria sp. PMC 1068.18]
MSTEDFYTSLPTQKQFLDLTDLDNYVSVPNDWYILITDVAGSTKAIEAGKYKEVNFVGASSIIAVINAVAPLQIPFIFGGDGASLLVPPSALSKARVALLSIKKNAQERFNLELRVGVVLVELVTAYCPLKIAKFAVTSYYSQASFIGGGLTYATNLVKSDRMYQLEITSNLPKANLSGLECRWQDLPSPHGQTLSLIVAAMPSGKKSSEEVYRETIKEIQKIYGQQIDYHPIKNSALKLTFNLRKLIIEAKARALSNSFCDRVFYLAKMLLENFLGLCFMKWKLSIGGVAWGVYSEGVITASDYQKIDDILRMIIAGKPEQTEQLTQYLEQQFLAGYLNYGLHISDRALMTCLIVENRHQHIHLIDGADGGFALAAKALKSRLHSHAINWKSYYKLIQHRQQQK